MNVDAILQTLNDEQVDYLLIGGMNFLLRHVPELTFDVDIWVEDSVGNRQRLNSALKRLGAEWGPTETLWKPVPADASWLEKQDVFCLTTQHGALDVFRDVFGLNGRYSQCRAGSLLIKTATGVPFHSLSDEDMLACQEVLPPKEQKVHRMEVLREAKRSSS